ncbi:uncharacterized protein LOC129594601 [Paramacrobiotus metropolitanus]|uniref:uncharacterized protein LOC129594601 n=1 Tax=Paramacrobiotus metropolitanus TaxID=2943436 RepID=UPI002445DA43|nr:uncharacterized protein LOC129594601 [Paramacrobiotus metropolitanus]
MSAFQVSPLAAPEDVANSFRTSLRSFSSASTHRSRKNDSAGSRRPKDADSAFASMESVNSLRSTSARHKRQDYRQRSRSVGPGRSAAGRGGGFNNTPYYDASIHNDTTMVSRYNQYGEMFTPVSYAWQAFKERLFDSSLSERYEVLHVRESPRNTRRYRSVSPNYVEEDEDEPQDSSKKLLFLQDPLTRSMYKNLETYFDRKTVIRGLTGGGLNGFSARSLSRDDSQLMFSDQGGAPPRSQSSLGFAPATARSLSGGLDAIPDMPRPQSSMAFSSTSLLSRKRRQQQQQQQPQTSFIKPDQDMEEVKREIEKRFARIDFDTGTADYEALFTVSDEMSDKLDEVSKKNAELNTAREHRGDNEDSSDVTPKVKLDRLRF